ncbi:hypothetical protein PRUPE_1G233600 [Prunus persica]|uniref:TLC domain-containing protein n=1 Tax=Prunus persica TaxID=3760 RepID=A0A251R2C6_PRUPE|nr:hypothetical protein PRUPE_1G233600 [Prunus persica]
MENSILGIPTLPAFFSIFLLIYLFAYFVVFRNWGPKHRPEASSCLISLAHGPTAAIMSIYSILHSRKAPTFASPNDTLQNTILEFSIAYFFLDLLHYLLFFPSDVLFILHHLATLYVFTTCRYVVHHGAYAILVLLFLAEITSGCQNVWTLASYRRADSPAAAKFGAAEPKIPRWAWVSWMVVILIAIGLSILWVLNLWIDWHRNKVQKKER